jgi:hypothetical protein
MEHTITLLSLSHNRGRMVRGSKRPTASGFEGTFERSRLGDTWMVYGADDSQASTAQS